jgi:hypothetical protein
MKDGRGRLQKTEADDRRQTTDNKGRLQMTEDRQQTTDYRELERQARGAKRTIYVHKGVVQPKHAQQECSQND